MNTQQAVAFVCQLIEQHRVKVGERPQTEPITWKGIGMTVEEAKLAIQGLEAEKKKHQRQINGSQIGGDITKLAAGGAGLAAMVTGTALLLFPPTAIAGAAAIAAGAGATGLGQVVGDGVKNIGTNSGQQAIHQIDEYIDSIKNAIIASI